MDPETTEIVDRIVEQVTRDSVAAHQRRVAIRLGREPDTAACPHANWDHARKWCDDCGVTKLELLLRRE